VTAAAVELDRVSVSYGAAPAVDELSATFEPGSWVALIGPNGAGKTSILRALCRLVPFSGDIRIDGRDARALKRRELARLVALVPQIPEMPPSMTVAEYVLLGRTPHLGYFASETRDDRAAAKRALGRLDLLQFAARSLGSLSGGELQRAVLARALAQEAQILLLDEPTSALDLGRQQSVLALVDSLRAGSDGLTVVAAMHDLTLAGQYADRLLLLDRGLVVADGPAHEVLSTLNVSTYYGAEVRIVHDDDGVFVLPLRR
jgi:iron complex transport system ATP-binding protein